MDISNWNIFYKYKNGARVRPNLVYVPYVSPDRDIFCMDFNLHKSYFFDRTAYTQEVCNFYFDNEIRWLEHYAKESFAPEIVDINKTARRIFFKWYDSSLNHKIENKSFDYKYEKQCKSILQELEKTVYKINYYPHTAYVDNNDNVRIHDFYGCVSKSNSYLPVDKIKPILGKIDVFRFGQYEKDGLINMSEVYDSSFKANTGEWPSIENIK